LDSFIAFFFLASSSLLRARMFNMTHYIYHPAGHCQSNSI
jgi:hypothetical protein